MRRVAALVLLTACGRFGFANQPTDDAMPANDVAIDSKLACPADAILCDDFETGDLAKWDGVYPSGVSSLVDTVRPHSGTHSLDSTVPAEMGNGGEAEVIHTFSVAQPMLGVRAWFYLPNPIESFQGVIYLVDLPAESHYFEIATDTAGWTAVGNGGTLMDYPSTVAAVTQTWTCVEVDVDAAAKKFQLYIDDAVALDTAIDDTSPIFNTLAIGATRANADGYRDFTDDVVVAKSHVGCN